MKHVAGALYRSARAAISSVIACLAILTGGLTPVGANTVTMQELQATCRGQGTIRQGPDGNYMCFLNNAAIAKYKAKERAACRRLKKTGPYTPDIQAACAKLLADKNPGTTETRRKPEKPNRIVQQDAPQPRPSAVANVAPTTESMLPVVTSPSAHGNRIALVIGNSSYRNATALQNSRRDAEAVAAALQRVGFQSVTLHIDLSREKLMEVMRTFSRQAEKADWALVYFAGHGIEIGGSNYLVPVDAKLETDRDVQYEAVPLDHVLGAVEPARKLRLVLLDACRDNPFVNQMRRSMASRSIGRGLASVEPEAGTLVAYAAKHREIALDGDGQNSPFVAALLKYLERPGIEVRRLFDFVRDDVLATTRNRQQPYTYGSLPASEDFFFVRPVEKPVAGAASTQ